MLPAPTGVPVILMILFLRDTLVVAEKRTPVAPNTGAGVVAVIVEAVLVKLSA